MVKINNTVAIPKTINIIKADFQVLMQTPT